MTGHGKWSTRLGYVYYVIGSIYYVYHWFLVLGSLAAVASVVGTYPLFVKYSAPAISLASLYLGVAFWRRQITFQLNGPNPSLRFERLEVSYKELDAINCEAQRQACVNVVYPIDHYVHKFNWSGDGDAIAEVISGARRAEVEEVPNGPEKACRIYFERYLNKKETRDFAYRLLLRNARKPLKSFLGHALDTPTRKLVMKAEFRPDKKPTRGVKQIFITERSEIPLWEEELDFKVNEISIVWEIDRPRNGYYYRISWS